jgi:hypothetical protein
MINMTAANTRSGGYAFSDFEPMVPVSGSNMALNVTGIPNVANLFCCGGNEQNTGTIRTTSISTGGILGALSGTASAYMQPLQGSSKYFIQGLPATRLGDISLTNAGNTYATQISPSQTKYFINV